MDNFFYAYKLTWFNEGSMKEEKAKVLSMRRPFQMQ